MEKVVSLLGGLIFLTISYGQTGREFVTFRGPCVFDTDQSDESGACSANETILLGGLFPLHSWTADESFPHGGYCRGGIHPVGFQLMEVMRFAIEQVNAAEIIPGVQLAFEIRDSCFSPDLTRQHALRFINRGIASEDQCNTTTAAHPISGVIGAPTSSSSIAAADLLGLFKVPQISYSSSSAALSNKDRYRYFLRTLAPDNFKAQAMMALINAFNSNYFSLLYSTDSFGQAGAAEIRAAVSSMGLKFEQGVSTCIAADESIGANTAGVKPSVYRKVLTNLVGEVARNASIAVVFSGPVAFSEFLQEAAKLNFSSHRLWIYSLSFATLAALSKGVPLSVVRGALGVEMRSNTVQGFESHFRSLHPDNNTEFEPSFNPWLSEYWQSVFHCNPNSADDREREVCRKNNLWDSSFVYRQSSFAPFVADAVYAFARGIRQLQQDKCGEGFRGICSAMLSSETARLGALDGKALLRHLLSLQFSSSAGHPVAFTSSGDLATAIYDIENLQVDEGTGELRFKFVGSWKRLTPGTHVSSSRRIEKGVLKLVHCLPTDTLSGSQSNCTLGELELNLSAIQWRNGMSGAESVPTSRCSTLCQPGYYADSLRGPFPSQFGRCCWRCERCSEHFVTSTQFQKCQRCPSRQRANNNQTSCVDISPDYWSIDHAQAVVCVVLSVIGIVLTVTMAVIGIYFKHLLPHNSALDIEPLLYCLVGALGLFTSVFIMIRKPTSTVCLLSDAWLSLSLTLLIAPFLVLVSQQCQSQGSQPHLSKRISQLSGLTEMSAISRNWLASTEAGARLLRGVILGSDIVLLLLASLSSSAEVDQDIDANESVQIGCPTSAAFISGEVFAILISIATFLALLYCQTHHIPVHVTLSRVGYSMIVALLLSCAGLGIGLVLSPIARASMRSFVKISVAFIFVMSAIVPDLFRSLKRAKRPYGSSQHFQSIGSIHVMMTALETVAQRNRDSEQSSPDIGGKSVSNAHAYGESQASPQTAQEYISSE